MEQGGYNFGSRVDYKLDSNKVYLKQTSYYPSTSVQEMYLSQVGDSYYVYQNNNNSWARYSISEEQFKQNNSNGLSGDTRMLLFDGNNYQNQGDYYLYVGDAVYIDYGNERIPFENITLTINGENLVISFTIGGGVMTGTYTFSNVNTTTVYLPYVA